MEFGLNPSTIISNMPLQKLQFRPGVNRESTTLTNEGGWFASDKIRFRSGSVEKLGGWLRDSGSITATAPTATFVSGGLSTSVPITGGAAFWGVVRSLVNWINLNGSNLLVWIAELRQQLLHAVETE